MTIQIWFGFFFSLGLLLIIARKSLWLGLVISSYVLGLFSLSFKQLWEQTIITVTDPSILLLSLAVGLIPMIAGVMEHGGLIDNLVNNVRMKSSNFMAFTAAFIGMLPMPGGALLSAPPVNKCGKTVSSETKTAINVWFRHVFLLIYPLGMLLAATTMAKINLYAVVLFLLPGFVLMTILGYLFLLRDIEDKKRSVLKINYKKTIAPVTVILIAPLIHFTVIVFFKNIIPEIPLVMGVFTSLILSLWFSRINNHTLKSIVFEMKPWNFALIIIGMFLFLHIFQTSDTSQAIADAAFPKVILLVGIGTLLGFATGRVQVPIAILLPIYSVQFGAETMTPVTFAIMYFAVYQGYVVSPVHPCILVSLEYFKTDLKDFYKMLALPAIICLIVVLFVGILIFNGNITV
jgi:integral membrane protein (TIGR00529 family)